MPSSPIPDFDRMSVGGSRFLSFSTKFNQMHPDSALAQKTTSKSDHLKDKKTKTHLTDLWKLYFNWYVYIFPDFVQ